MTHSPYDGIGSWQNRVFAVPPAMGIDYRCVNGYIYISGNAVTDPAKIAERAEYFYPPGTSREELLRLFRPVSEGGRLIEIGAAGIAPGTPR